MIAISDLLFRYPEGEFELNVPELEVATGETVAVIGPSGSGKTTLLHLMAGIRLPQKGHVVTDEVEVTSLDDGDRRDFRIRRIGMVFQEFELLEYLTVLDNILLPYRISRSLKLDRTVRERAAEALEAGVGGSVISSPESVFDIAGVYPLKMHVVGILEPSYTADDIAVFVDLKTAWIIQGLIHGHQDMAAANAVSGVLSREGDNIVANASVVQYAEVTSDNIASFHFHGSVADYPISAVIAVPHDQKSGTILMGRFESPDDPAQILQPTTVIDDLLGTIFTVQNFVVAGMLLVGLAALGTAVLVFVLSLKLRKREIETMAKIGGSRERVAGVLITEIAVVVSASVVLAGILTAFTARFASTAVRLLLLQ